MHRPNEPVEPAPKAEPEQPKVDVKRLESLGAKPVEEPKVKLSEEAQKEADAKREAANQKLNDLLKK